MLANFSMSKERKDLCISIAILVLYAGIDTLAITSLPNFDGIMHDGILDLFLMQLTISTMYCIVTVTATHPESFLDCFELTIPGRIPRGSDRPNNIFDAFAVFFVALMSAPGLALGIIIRRLIKK